jgi:nucleotidyltransferase substrate binding protein (TIGR01987 family)
MDKIDRKLSNLVKAYEAFERSLKLYQNPPSKTQAELEAYTASLIKHFELYYESLCKFLKAYLLIVHGETVSGSKTIFRTAHEQKIIDDKELEQLLLIVDNRNATTHVYDEESAVKICNLIIGYSSLLKNLLDKIKKLNSAKS